MSAHEALVALAQDLVTEVAAGMAVELAAGMTAVPASPAPPPRPAPKGAAAVHQQLGQFLAVLPGDTISGLAYAHLQLAPPPGSPAPGAGPPGASRVA
jgi:hypothetical protein